MRFKLVLFCTALAVLGATSLESQTRVLTGRVVEATTGAGIGAANISVVGSLTETFAGQDGSFSVAVPVGDVVLTVQRIGFRVSTIPVPAGQNNVVISLDVDALLVDEVVVTGLVTNVSRRNLANAVASVQGNEVRHVTSHSIEHALQGKVLGAYIQTNSGAPGGGAQVRMRGITSINATASPLWIIDGVVASDVAIPNNQNVVTGASSGNNPSLFQDNQVNRIVDLNPEDIESIEVLKGASASAIYGSKASNGVIIVTTRRGVAGAPRLNVRQRFGFFDLSNKLGFREFATVADYDAIEGAGAAAAIGFQPGVTFDHEEALAGRNALSHETAFDVSGGSDETRYFISGLWQDDEGIMDNTGFAKQSLRVNVDQVFGDRVSASLSSNLIHTNARRGLSNNDNLGVSPYMVWAATRSVLDLSQQADGSFPVNPFDASNPIATLAQMENDEDVWRILASGRVDWNVYDGDNQSLTLLGTAGIDYFQQKNRLFFPPELQFEDDDGFLGTSLLSNSDNLNTTLNASAVHTYDMSGGTTFTTSAGVQYETTDLDISRIESRGLTAGQPNVSAGSNVNVRQKRSRIEDLGFFLQEEVLTFDDRLFLTASIRADQSSVNADPTQLHYFPKVAASWRIPDIGNGILDDIKFRVAYGESGNLPLYGDRFTPLEATNVIAGIAGTVIPTSNLDAITGSPTLQPERQKEIETGVDASLFGGRASLEFSLYQKNISDLIVRRRLAPSSGLGEEIINGGKLRTRGVEVGVGVTPVQSENFNWLFRTSFFLNRSEITQLDVPSFLPTNGGFRVSLGQVRIEEGMSATQMVGNVGVDGAGSPIEGVVGDVNPDYNVGFTNDLNYNNFGLYFHLDWQQGGDIMNLTKLLYDLVGSNTAGFDDPDHQGLTGTERNAMGPFGAGQQTGIYVEEATFLKLRGITLSYQLGSNLVASIWGSLDRVSLTLSARNFLTFSKYTGLDPEVSNFGNQPSGRNIDVAPFLPSRSFWFGIDVGF